jgi:hypothetical protein
MTLSRLLNRGQHNKHKRQQLKHNKLRRLPKVGRITRQQ